MPTDEAIRERSYLIWESEGRPSGKELEHWVRAKRELEGKTPAAPRRAAKRAAPAAATEAPVKAKRRASR